MPTMTLVQEARQSAALNAVKVKIEELNAHHKALETEIAALQAEIAELKSQEQRAGVDRQMENKQFSATIAEQMKTKAALQQAYDKLAGFYLKHQTFIQEPAETEAAKPTVA